MIKIAPSILASDFSRLGEEINKIESAGADMVHIDIMDGHFVPNITIGPPVVKSLRKTTKLDFDVHLMIENPDKYLDDFIDAGADIVTVHAECCYHLNRVIQKIKKRGKRASVALNPGTSLTCLDWIIDDIDIVLLMTVNPGFGGQTYINSITEKVVELRKILDRRNSSIDIEVDGGIDLENIYTVTKAGANIIVAGTTVFKAPDTAEIISELKKRAFVR